MYLQKMAQDNGTFPKFESQPLRTSQAPLRLNIIHYINTVAFYTRMWTFCGETLVGTNFYDSVKPRIQIPSEKINLKSEL